MMKLMSIHHSDETADERVQVDKFRSDTLSMYLNSLDARTFWQTLNKLVYVTYTMLHVLGTSYYICRDSLNNMVHWPYENFLVCWFQSIG